MDYYEELGVAPDATTAEIRLSYLALARRHHPDRLSGASPAERASSSSRMARINAAWAVLSDRDRRAAYDATWCDDSPSTGGATIRDAGSSWTPFDDSDDPVDPRLLDDTPSGAPTLRRGVTFLPAGLASVGVVALVVGFVINLGELAALGLLVLVGAGVAFLLVPLMALFNSSRADREG